MNFIDKAISILTTVNFDSKSIIKMLEDCKNKNGTIYTCGNGGSGSTASHLTSDLLSIGYSSVCLNDNTARLTAIANDFDYSEVFSRLLNELEFNEYDLLFIFSCSGNSVNVVKASETAKKFFGRVVVFTSNGGGVLAKTVTDSDIIINVPTNNIFLAEGIHSILTHALVNEL